MPGKYVISLKRLWVIQHLAICDEQIAAKPEDSEQIEVVNVSEERFMEMLLTNEFLHGGGIAAYLKYCLGK